MSGFRDILVAFDGSPPSERAMQVSIELARGANARLTVLMSAPHIPAVAYIGASGFGAAALGRTVEQRAHRELVKRIERIPDDVCVTTIFTERPIRGAIMDRIRGSGHDLVVLGSRGRGRIRSALLGSVSSYVVAHSPIPVLVVQSPWRRAAGEPEPQTSVALPKPTPRAA